MKRPIVSRSLAAILLAAILIVGAFVAAPFAADEEKGILASVISQALSTPASRVSIGAIEGALSSNATIRNVELADRDGTWLKLDRARIVWSRLALLSRRLEIDTLEIDHLDIARKPIPAEVPVANEKEPLLPELPVKVIVKDFKMTELALGEPILGTAARLAASGAAVLGNPKEGLNLRLDVNRLDQPGLIAARLALVSDGSKLDLGVKLDEPQGGLLVRAAKIPGLPPAKLDLTGTGSLDQFGARLDFNAGPDIGAAGTADVHREGTARRFALDLSSRIAGLLPPIVAPVFEGTTNLNGAVLFGDDSSVTIPDLHLNAAAARLNMAGTLSPAQVADLRITATNLPRGAADRTDVSGAEIKRLALDTHITGDLTAPRIEAKLNAEEARLPAARLSRLDATFSAVPSGPVSDAATRIRLTGDARASGLALTNPSLAQAVGTEAIAVLRGSSTVKGEVDLDQLEVKSSTVDARFTGHAASDELKGKLDLSAPDLSRFGGIAGLALRGNAAVAADIEGTPRANRYDVTVDGRVTEFGTGIAQVDGLFGGRLGLNGAARLYADGGFGFDKLTLAGPNATASLDGTAGQQVADVRALLTVPNLARADARLTGRGQLDAHLTGTLDHPDATARIEITSATALGRPVPRLLVEANARDIKAGVDATVTLDGELDRKPARGTLHLARPGAGPNAGTTTLDGADVSIGSVALNGAVSLDAANLAAGRLTLKAGNLDDLSPLALQKLSGVLDADVQLSTPNGGQDAQVKANGQRISASSVALDRLAADLQLTDIYRRPIVAGTVAIDEAKVGGETISRVRLNAQGSPQFSDITATASARRFEFDAKARVTPGDAIRVDLAQFGATRGRDRIGLADGRTATVTIKDGAAEIRNLALGIMGGRLAIEGTAGSRLDLRAKADRVPLQAAQIVSPGLQIAGTFEGEADIKGTTSAPTGTYRAKVDGLALPQTRSAGLPPIDATAQGRLEGQRATIDASVLVPSAGTIRIGGSAPLGGSGALDIAVKGDLDTGVANRLLGASGRRVTGRVAVDAKVGGSLGTPQVSGSATLSGGSFQDAANGVQLDGLSARLVARGQDVTIENARASTKNGGTIGASGRVRLDPGAGFPGEIRVNGQNAQLIQSALATAILNINLNLSGPLARDPRIGGRVDIVSLDVPVPSRLPSSLQPLPGTRHIRPTRTAAARLAKEGSATKKGGKAAPPFDAVLDVTVAAPGPILVHGRGLDANLGGELRVTGTLAKPRPVGAFNLRRGTLEVLTSRLDFTRGNLTFAGDLTPELDFLANTSAGGAQIGIAVTGPANDPAFQFTSNPDLPQDEILSRLLFGTSTGQLSTGQALALASAAAQYSGDGQGPFENLRRSLGISGGDILGSSGGGPLGQLSRGVSDRVSIGIRTGATPAQTGIGADVKITDTIKLKGEVGALGGATVGIGAEKEW